MYVKKLTLIWTTAILFWTASQSSIVKDMTSDDGIYISDYCPKMPYCPEGAHVMCMYYNPQQKMGAACHNPKDVSITPELANRFLHGCNLIRSKLAFGKETGKSEQLLPRGYGMFRLKWDYELATFAQVLANQCVLKHDLCRATKRFSDPSQTVGLVRFSYPDWYPVNKGVKFNTSGLTNEKIIYAATQALKSWYGQKVYVTPDMINNHPDWIQHPENDKGRLYLEMIYGPATHMGCGISGYTQYYYQDDNVDLYYNSLQVVCNFSARPRKGLPVYNTSQPQNDGKHSRCGCPYNAYEDSDCLCHYKNVPKPNPPKHHRTCESDRSCNPPVVVLPIFTVEDAPSHKLTLRQSSNTDILQDLYAEDAFTKEGSELTAPKHKIYENFLESELMAREQKRYPSKMISNNVKKRYFDKKSFMLQDYHNEKSQKQQFGHVPVNRRSTYKSRKSIFSRAPKFKLLEVNGRRAVTNIYHNKNTNDYKNSTVKRDVRPRKDFSNLDNLVKSYINKKRSIIGLPKKQVTLKYFDENMLHNKINNFPRTKLINKKEKVKSENQYNYNYQTLHRSNSGQNLDYKVFNITNQEHLRNFESPYPNEEGDTKLMTLLNTLEQEVRNIQLNTNEKEIFDVKIRKIYGDVVGNPAQLLHPAMVQDKFSKKHDISVNNQLEDIENIEQKIIEGENFARRNYQDYNIGLQHRYGTNNYDSDDDYLHNDNKNNNKKIGNFNDAYYDKRRLSYNNRIKTLSDYKNTLGNTFEDNINTNYDLDAESIGENINDHKRHYKKEDWNGRNRRMNNIGLKSRNIITFNNHFTENIDSNLHSHPYKMKDMENLRRLFEDDMVTHSYPISENEEKYSKIKHVNNGEMKTETENDDILSYNRRKYYQDKLNNIERKLHSIRNHKHQNEHNTRKVIAVRPTSQDIHRRPSKTENQISPIYTADRARILHNF